MPPHSRDFAENLRTFGYGRLKSESNARHWQAVSAESLLGIPHAVCPWESPHPCSSHEMRTGTGRASQSQGRHFRVRRDPGTIAKRIRQTTSPVCRLYGQVGRLKRAIQAPPLRLWTTWSNAELLLLVVSGFRNSNWATEKVGGEKIGVGVDLTVIHFCLWQVLPRRLRAASEILKDFEFVAKKSACLHGRWVFRP
jgi:hypothetical protein